MSNIFALSSSILKDIKPKPYYNNILMIFTQDNPLKIAVDSDGLAIDNYTLIAEESEDELISTWLTLMIHDPSNFEPIGKVSSLNCDCEIEFYLRISIEIFGESRIILASKQECKNYEILTGNLVRYNDSNIVIYDKDESLQIIKQIITQSHTGSGDNIFGNKIINKNDNHEN